jgi:hypothetical protein
MDGELPHLSLLVLLPHPVSPTIALVPRYLGFVALEYSFHAITHVPIDAS